MTIWSILRPLEIFYGHLVNFMVIWYIFLHFGILDQEKSGNPDRLRSRIWQLSCVPHFSNDGDKNTQTTFLTRQRRHQKVTAFETCSRLTLGGRVARWFVFKPKIPIWVNFVGSCYEKYWYIL
jgi:hypothetical protein